MSPARIVLADDHQLVRQGVKALLQTQPDLSVVGEAATGQEALRLVEQLQPDILILDMVLPDQKGMAVLAQINQCEHRPRVLILSMYSDEAYVLQAVQERADGYVLKESSAEELTQAVREIVAGRHYLTPPLSEYVIKAYVQLQRDHPVENPHELLSDREREVLEGIVRGQTNLQIAADLSLSRRTVETYRSRLMGKLGVRTQAELIQRGSQLTTAGHDG